MLTHTAIANVRMDFDGDGKTDPTVYSAEQSPFQTSRIYWHVLESVAGYSVTQWGAFDFNTGGYEDKFVPADYDGDGKTDYAIWRTPLFGSVPTQSYYYILYSATNTFSVTPFGIRTDNKVPADYDGDGKADIAITRNSGGALYWWILQSRDGLRVERWGGGGPPMSGDNPVPADYDGDGKADLAVIRYTGPVQPPPPYTWYILRSSDGNWIVKQFGTFSNDVPCVGDYDGDGKADICMVGVGGDFPTFNWRWVNSSNGEPSFLHWGSFGDKAIPGDYDGDGKTDPTIYRIDGSCTRSSAFWISGSLTGLQLVPFGNCHMSAIDYYS